jgi:hypothetical protein
VSRPLPSAPSIIPGISAITKIENLCTIPRFGFKVVNG